MPTVKANRDCTRCALHETAQTVCLMGRGKIPSDVMLIGEAPGYREDDIGKPFQGQAGQDVLDPVLNELGISRNDIYITNIVRCRPPDNRTPKKREIEACRKWMEKEIRLVKPKYVLLLGRTALQVCPSWRRRTSLADARGKCVQHEGINYFSTYHPAACLPGRDRRGSNLASFKVDMASFFRLVGSKGKVSPAPLNHKCVTTLDQFNGMLDAIKQEEYISFVLFPLF